MCAVTAEEAEDLARRIAAAWNVTLDDDALQGWRLTLVPLSQSLGLRTLADLHGEPVAPSFRRFLEHAQTLASGGKPTGAGTPAHPRRHCPLCGGTGWREATVAGGDSVDAVVRCDCAPVYTGKHPARCTCRSCLPGGPDADAPAEPRRKGPHPLEYRGTKATDGHLL